MIAAKELAPYGVRVNAIAPAARTWLTGALSAAMAIVNRPSSTPWTRQRVAWCLPRF